MKKATSSGSSTPTSLRLADQDRHAGFQLRRLDRHRQAPAEARFEPLLQPIDLFRIAIAGQDHLVLALDQRVEGVEELLLRTLLAGEELDVIDQQRMQRAVGVLEFVDAVVLQRSHHVADEALGMHVGDARVRIALADQVADRVHQVGLAEADAAVDEQRVVGGAGIFRDLQRRGLGEVIALAFDETVEGEIGVERHAERMRHAAGAARRSPRRLPAARRRRPAASREPISIETGRPPSARSSASMRVSRLVRTQSTTKRLGASRRSRALLSMACRGLTQVLNCCSGSSCFERTDTAGPGCAQAGDCL